MAMICGVHERWPCDGRHLNRWFWFFGGDHCRMFRCFDSLSAGPVATRWTICELERNVLTFSQVWQRESHSSWARGSWILLTIAQTPVFSLTMTSHATESRTEIPGISQSLNISNDPRRKPSSSTTSQVGTVVRISSLEKTCSCIARLSSANRNAYRVLLRQSSTTLIRTHICVLVFILAY